MAKFRECPNCSNIEEGKVYECIACGGKFCKECQGHHESITDAIAATGAEIITFGLGKFRICPHCNEESSNHNKIGKIISGIFSDDD